MSIEFMCKTFNRQIEKEHRIREREAAGLPPVEEKIDLKVELPAEIIKGIVFSAICGDYSR
ncbi:hypothetical protein HII36_44240 [Nonomuraea sp. NN258]|uniref:hypothetical protein n=1 Tax=Nonomuraea antri TaxID=2730852 RepID=UPI00156A6AAC|nr:hypothetical protein [Nonomuraea antri]NRQ38787.1 hypothetical protein [Nonomuraea antri]